MFIHGIIDLNSDSLRTLTLIKRMSNMLQKQIEVIE